MVTASTVWAQEHQEDGPSVVSTDPVLLEEVMPTPRGEWELRSSTEYWSDGDASRAAPRVQLFRGVTDRVSIELAMPLMYRPAGTARYGAANLGAGVKMRLSSPSAAMAWVAGLEVSGPTRTAGIGEDATEISPSLGIVVPGRHATWQSRVAWSHGVGQDAERAVVVQGAVIVRPLSRLALLAEVEGIRGIGSSETPSFVIAPGTRFALWAETSIGLSVPLRVQGARPSWGLVGQVQYGWN